jgi:hypothetical protein
VAAGPHTRRGEHRHGQEPRPADGRPDRAVTGGSDGIGKATALGLAALADKGYDGAGAGVLTPTKGGNLHPDNLTRNQLIGCLRAQGERGIALLKTRWKALNRIRLCPQRIGAIAKAALVLTTAERPIR